jgi:hypothetical protein
VSKIKIYAHGSYIGNTGYNHHTRDFFRSLSKYFSIKFRNFTVGDSWKGLSETPHDEEDYIDALDKNLLYSQRLWVGEGRMEDFKIYPSPEKEFGVDLNIVLNESNHYLYYENYSGPKIAYNVWESTRQTEDFFKKLHKNETIHQECRIELVVLIRI